MGICTDLATYFLCLLTILSLNLVQGGRQFVIWLRFFLLFFYDLVQTDRLLRIDRSLFVLLYLIFRRLLLAGNWDRVLWNLGELLLRQVLLLNSGLLGRKLLLRLIVLN